MCDEQSGVEERNPKDGTELVVCCVVQNIASSLPMNLASEAERS